MKVKQRSPVDGWVETMTVDVRCWGEGEVEEGGRGGRRKRKKGGKGGRAGHEGEATVAGGRVGGDDYGGGALLGRRMEKKTMEVERKKRGKRGRREGREEEERGKRGAKVRGARGELE